MSKSILRAKILAERRGQKPLIKNKKDAQIVKRLVALPLFKKAHTISIYNSMPDEISTKYIVKKYLNKKRIVMPKVSKAGLIFYEIGKNTLYERGDFGIEEPTAQAAPFKNLKQLDLIIVPGIVFDTRGNRIGFGKGYFDRFLKKVNCTTIALAYELQIVDKIKPAPYDVPVDYIITEKRTIQCRPQSNNKIRKSTKS